MREKIKEGKGGKQKKEEGAIGEVSKRLCDKQYQKKKKRKQINIPENYRLVLTQIKAKNHNKSNENLIT